MRSRAGTPAEIKAAKDVAAAGVLIAALAAALIGESVFAPVLFDRPSLPGALLCGGRVLMRILLINAPHPVIGTT